MRYIPPFLKDVAADGALKHTGLYYLGSFMDMSGNEATISSKSGALIPGQGWKGYIVYADKAAIRFTNFSFGVLFGANLPAVGTEYIIDKADAGGTNIRVWFTATGMSINDGSTTVTVTYDFTGCKYVGVSTSATGTPVLYTDKDWDGNSFSGAVTITENDAPLTIGANYSLANGIQTPMQSLFYSGNVLTATEHKNIFDGMSDGVKATRGPSSFVNNAMIKPPYNLDGCPLALDGSMVGTAVGNLGTGDNGTNYGAQPIKKHVLGGGFNFDGASYIDMGTDIMEGVTNNFLLNCWFYSDVLSSGRLFSRRDASGSHFDIYLNSSRYLNLYNGTSTYTTTAQYTQSKLTMATVAMIGGVLYMGFNGTLENKGSVTLTNQTTNLYIGKMYLAGSFITGKILNPYILTQLPVDASGNTITPANWAKMEYQKGLRALKQYCATGMRETVSALSAGAWIMPREIQLVTGTATVTGVFVNENHFFKINFTSASTVSFAEHLGVGGHLYGWTDTGSGMEWGEITMTSRVASFASGSALYISRQPGYAIYDRLLEEL